MRLTVAVGDNCYIMLENPDYKMEEGAQNQLIEEMACFQTLLRISSIYGSL